MSRDGTRGRQPLTRRRFGKTVLGAAATAMVPAGRLQAARPKEFRLRYILASSLYGRLPVEVILEQVRKTGAEAIDIWPERHGNQREQIEAMGHERFQALLAKHDVKLGIYSCFNPGLLRCEKWMRVLGKLGGSIIVANSGGPRNLSGDALRQEIRRFAERLKPQVELAEELGLSIAVENHSGSLVSSAESQIMFLDAVDSPRVGIALAPYHLPQDATAIAELILKLGSRLLHFYAWEHGEGARVERPAIMALKQLPGFGSLDFQPIIDALARIDYRGWTSIFMHPTPRSIPILPTAEEATLAINLSREYLEVCSSRI